MKKFQKALASLGLGVMAMCTGVACGDADKVVGAEIMVGSMATTIAKGTNLDTSKLKAQIKLKNGDYKTVDASELEFDQSGIDTSKVGEDQVLKVKYGDFEFEVVIRIVPTEADVASIASLESQLVIDYNSNKGDQENDRNEFYQTKKNDQGEDVSIIENIKVGTDNPFNFRLNAAGWDGSGKLVTGIPKVRTNIKVELHNGDSFELLDQEDIDLYFDKIDTENAVLDFKTKAAEDKATFRVTVSAANKNEGVEEEAVKFDAILDVVEGYNVYNATDLSIYDNSYVYGDTEYFPNGVSGNQKEDLWKSKKLATGMATENQDGSIDYLTTKAVILQDNITVTKEDIPDGYFWNEATEGNTSPYKAREVKVGKGKLNGTPKDFSGRGLYTRYFRGGDSFGFEGNYFTVDMSQFPKAVASDIDEGDPEKITQYVNVEESHMMSSNLSTFFNDFADVVNREELNVDTDVNVRNVKFFGNSALNNDVVNSGGIILMHCQHVDLEAFNTIHHNFYIGYFTENGSGPKSGEFNVNYSKGYNSFSALFYCYGSEELTIRNSEFIDCGGPAIIANHGHIDDTLDLEERRYSGVPTHVNIINTNIHSYVTGKEGWFANYGAGDMIATKLSPLDNALKSVGKTMFVDEIKGTGRIDLVGLIMDTSSGGLTEEAVLPRGYIRIFANEEEYNAFYNPAEGQYPVNYGLDMYGLHALNARANKAFYIEDGVYGGYFNSMIGENNNDTSYVEDQLPRGYRLTILETVLADAITAYEQAMKVATENSEFSYAGLKLEQQKSALQTIIKNLATVDIANLANPSTQAEAIAQIQNFLKVYAMGRVNLGLIPEDYQSLINTSIWSENNDALFADIQTKLAGSDYVGALQQISVLADALCKEVANMTNSGWVEGNRINLYIGTYGLGLTLGVIDTPQANA